MTLATLGGGTEDIFVSRIGLDAVSLTLYTRLRGSKGATVAELLVLNQASIQAKSVPKDGLPVPIQVAAGLEKISLALKSRTWRREGQAGLGPLQRQVLTLLRSKPNHSAQVSTIAQELVVRLPTASEAVATLERKRLVKRYRSHPDRRVVTVELTARGSRACAPAVGIPNQLATATSALTSIEQVAFLKGLMKVIRSLQQQGEISVARMCVSCRFFRPHQHEDAAQPHHCDYVNAPIGDQALRLDCAEYEAASASQAKESWDRFNQERKAVN
jgi:DNA-binding MarR family transcriptional regulator